MRDERREDDDEQVIPPWDTDSQSAKANNRSGVQTEEVSVISSFNAVEGDGNWISLSVGRQSRHAWIVSKSQVTRCY